MAPPCRARWQIVEAVYLVLCDLAQRNPGDHIKIDGRYTSIERHVEDAWQSALINPHLRYPDQEPEPEPAPGLNPWAYDGRGDYSDEPPF